MYTVLHHYGNTVAWGNCAHYTHSIAVLSHVSLETIQQYETTRVYTTTIISLYIIINTAYTSTVNKSTIKSSNYSLLHMTKRTKPKAVEQQMFILFYKFM